VARELDQDELIDRWTVVEDELALVAGKRGATRLGFSLLLHEGLNVVDSWNRANAVIFYGKGGDLATNRRDEQEMSVLCLRILHFRQVFGEAMPTGQPPTAPSSPCCSPGSCNPWTHSPADYLH
jgi:Tn3 transposase DDE domain